jgi:tetratricopeptide (TPR) repeat protein
MLDDLEQEQATRIWRRKTRSRLVWAAAGLALVTALVVAGTLWLKSRPATVPAGPRAALVLLPFRNATNDPSYDWTRTGLPDLLRAELQESKQLSLVSEDRVREIVDGLKLDQGDELQPATLQRIAFLIGVENLLKADLFKLGEQFRIEANLLNVGTSSIASEAPLRVEGRGEDALFEMIEELGRDVRRELGLSRRRGSSGKPSTESVEALRLYSEGADLAHNGNELEAAQRLEAALDADPQFATARALLAETYDNLGRDQEAIEAAEQAAAELSRVSPVEAARIRAVRARLSEQPEAALAAYQEWCALAPNEPAAFLALATFQEDSGDLEGALASMLKVIELDGKNANAHYALGRIKVRSGDLNGGLAELNEALSLHVETGNEQGRATALNGLGNTYSFLGDFDNAMSHYRESLEVREAIGDLRGVGAALNNISQLLHETGNFDEAVENQQRCLAVYEELGDRERLASSYGTLGDIYSRSGRPEEALEAFQESMTILREVGDVYALAEALGNMGYIYTLLGQYNEAFFFLSDALEKQREAGERGELLRSLVYIGILEQVQGHYDRALRYYSEGLTLAREAQHREWESILSANLANIHYDQGDYAAALALLDEVEAASRESQNVYVLADCLTYQGELRQALGDPAGAESALDEAWELAEERNSPTLNAEILVRRGELRLAQGQRDEAVAALQDAVAAATESKDHRLQLVTRLRSAQAGRSVRDMRAVAEEASESGLAPVAARARLALAQRRLEQREHAQAATEAETLIEEATPLAMRDTLFQARTVCVTAYDKQGRQDRAAEHAAAALDLLQEMRSGLEGDALASFLARPEATRFATEAQRVFDARGETEPSARLATLLTP